MLVMSEIFLNHSLWSHLLNRITAFKKQNLFIDSED